MNNSEPEIQLHIHPRPTEAISLSIPVDTVESLMKVAASRGVSLEALLKFYVGQGLRQDISRLFSEKVLETTAQVLARHIQSEEEISTIIREIQVEAGQ
jgi:hypothetical protein